MKLDVSARAIRGAREYQEDSCEVCIGVADRPSSCLAVLCDGMGGHAGGEIASQLATRAFADRFLSLAPPEDPAAALRVALESAHLAVIHAIEHAGAPSDMATTLVALYVESDDVYWISVGDSHVLHHHDGKLAKLNADHSMAKVLDDLVAIDRMTRDEALSDPRRSVVRSCVSFDDIALVDEGVTKSLLSVGDTLLLASDGLDTLSLSEVEATLVRARGEGADRVVADLLADVEAAGNEHQDNTSIAAIKVLRGWQLW